MIDAVKNETPEEKTFRLLKRYDRRVIVKVVSEFEIKNRGFRYICKETELKRCADELASLKRAVVTVEDKKQYEIDFARIWKYRASLQKNLIDPPEYLDALEAHIWKYGWSLDEYANFTTNRGHFNK